MKAVFIRKCTACNTRIRPDEYGFHICPQHGLLPRNGFNQGKEEYDGKLEVLTSSFED